jgi:hypothetical protein
MLENDAHPKASRGYSEPARSALDLIEKLVIEGLRHGHFDYSLTCETGTNGRR